jgi:hypothetical protein
MVRVIGPKDGRDKNAINTTSSSTNWSRELSPFFLGPIPLYFDLISKNMENAWQYTKIYKCHVDQNGNPIDDYWTWSLTGWNKARADRYPMGKNAIPLYSFWDNKKLNYIEARKFIYLPLYQNAVIKTEAFKKLKELYIQNNKNIILFDFDGYDHLKIGKSLSAVLNDPNRKMGHAFVLAMMLEYGENFKIEDLT